ncbi:hypothetical protein SADUNF_Sadunf08G0061100 [Salix dunnii]|uniref:Ubiquitin fusion degradation protein UFD1 N-terminal subdomain 1 domain-containing protein n=1 Tax=Salix dunnii TaxID=1413687 RepID=A0A835JV50_9ROSI|nr:hypothetical protein SADUNF_Sadunf08G0061100 [Salix dunnii]
MPASALDRLAMLEISYPMLFQLGNPLTGHVSHRGVLEITAEKGFVCLPQWMMENLKLEKGSVALIKNVDLVKGTYIKYSHIPQPKPSSSISIVETDCEVDLAPPLDCQERELERLVKRLSIEDDKEQPLSFSQHPSRLKEDQEQPVMQEFIAFTGAARRSDGKAMASIPVTDCPPVQQQPAGAPTDAGSSNNSSKQRKLDFGSGLAEAHNASRKLIKEGGKVESLEKEEEKFNPFAGISFKLTDE